MKGARVPALLTGLAAALVVAGCGVPPSGVIQAGDPATGMLPGITLYFLSGDTLSAVPRRAPADADAVAAVRMLFAGPTEAEAGRLRTQLPRLSPVSVIEAKDGTLYVRLPDEGPLLSRPALEQLACTADAAPSTRKAVPGTKLPTPARGAAPFAAATPVDGAARVIVTGTSWKTVQVVPACPVPVN
jgi:hypothetical protein